MRYLVIEEKRINPYIPLEVIRNYDPKVMYCKTTKGRLQFFFRKDQLTRKNVEEISRKLGMRVIKLTDTSAVIGY